MNIVVAKVLLGEHSHYVRVRTGKSKRLDKKFLKKYGRRSIRKCGPQVYVVSGEIMMCPVTLRKLKITSKLDEVIR